MTRPEYYGGPRDGERYRRPVAPGEQLVVLAYDVPPPACRPAGHVYALRHRRDGRPVLACVGPAPALPQAA